MSFSVIFFDLDDTLYPSHSGLWAAIRQRMSDYMHQQLGIDLQEIPLLRKHYLETYGTTLRGLQQFYPVDSDEYLAFVHDLPLRQFIQPNPALRELILSIKQPRWIFTNADDRHAQRVLDILQLTGCFEGIIDVRRMNFLNKPDPLAYEFALRTAGASDPRRPPSWFKASPRSSINSCSRS